MEAHFATLSQPLTIDLDELLRDYLLGLVLIAGVNSDTASMPVQWVHSSDLVDPTPFLTPRTVLLTTGRQFGAEISDQEANDYVQRLVTAGTTALGVAISMRWDRIPPALIAACDHHQLALFRVPYDTPFIAIVRTAARLLEARRSQAWDREQRRSGVISRRQNLAQAERELRRATLRLLLAGQSALANDVASALLPRLPRGQLIVAVFTAPALRQSSAELLPLLTETDGVFSTQQEQRITVILESEQLSALKRVLKKESLAAGISERGGAGDLTELKEQAERAAELAASAAASANAPGSALEYRPEMHPGVIRLLQQSPEAARRASGLLAPLTDHDKRHGDELAHSLKVWLSHHGQTSPAAAELGIHRHTLRTRMNQAASLLHRDFDDPDTRAELWAALRLTS